jgi:hemoglobin/transferrin/lactoferrin receptor protein
MGDNRKHGFSNWGNESIIAENNIQKETAYQQVDFFHKTLFQLTKNNFLLFNSLFSTSSNINRFDKLNDLKDGENKYLYWYYGPQKRILQSVRLKNYKHTVFSNEAVFTASFQDVKESRHKQKQGANLLNNRTESLQIFDLKADLLKQVNKLKINYGFDSRFQQLESTANLSSDNNIYYNTSRYPEGGTNVLNNAIYLQLNYQGLKNIDILLGTRYNVNSLSSKFRDTTTIKLPFDEILVENKSLSNSIQMHYKASKNFTFNASISNGFRNPNTDDIGKIFSKDDISVILPNNQLSPEKSFNFEAGLVANFNKLITFQLQVFQTQIIDAIERRYAKLNGNDSIIYDGEMMKVMMNQNIGKATISGINFAYHINLTKKLTHNGSINILKGETSDNLPLAHIPPKNIISELNYSIRKQLISFSIHYNGIKKAEDYDLSGVDNLEEATQIGNPSWYTLNLKHKINIDKNLTFITGIYNITDTHYKTFGSGISASGRNFSLSLQVKF